MWGCGADLAFSSVLFGMITWKTVVWDIVCFFGWVDARSDKKTKQKSQIKEKTTLNDVKTYMKYLR